jgi:predicted transcriptional regulator
MANQKFSPIERSIVGTLKKEGKPLSTYRLAKKSKISWSAVNLHCYKLKYLGVLDSKTKKSPYGQKKVIWTLSNNKDVIV